MPIADEIRLLAGRTHQELNALHDFLNHTKLVWSAFQESVNAGEDLTYTNPVTGTTVIQADLVRLSQRYTGDYLTAFTFQRFVAVFEQFLFDLLRLVVANNPHPLGRKQVEFRTILAAPDREALITLVIDRELNELKYARLREWFDYLEGTLHLGCPAADEIDTLAEVKATRDVLEHNAGVANTIYTIKAGSRARYRPGEQVEIPDPYYQESWALIKKVIGDVTVAATTRLSPPASTSP